MNGPVQRIALSGSKACDIKHQAGLSVADARGGCPSARMEAAAASGIRNGIEKGNKVFGFRHNDALRTDSSLATVFRGFGSL